MDESLFYHGLSLRNALTQTLQDRKLLIEGYIPEKSINMLYASDGIGKSTVNLQSMAEASCGYNVFEGLFVESPLKVMYILGERGVEEPFERLLSMDHKLKLNFDNFAITDKLQGFNLQNANHHPACLKILEEIGQKAFNNKVDIINFDPIYSLCGGKLSADEDVSTLRNFILKVKKMFDCSIFIVHHENKGTYNVKTKKREGADFYGNKFLSAMCNGVWHLKARENGDGTIIFNEKDSYKNLLKQIPLTYDEETYTSKIDVSHSSVHIRFVVKAHLNHCYKTSRKFCLNDLKSLAEGVCNSTFRKILNPHLATGKIVNCNPLGQKALYEVKEEIL